MLVSIIITSYNYGEYLGRSIESALEQTLKKDLYEILVVDAGSTDSTQEVLKNYISNIILVDQTEYPERKGLAAGCNIGLERAKGEYVVRLDADDTFEPDLLETSLKVLENSDASFTYSDYYVFEDSISRGVKNLPEFDEKEILSRGDFLPLGMFCRKKDLLHIGKYNEELETLENFELVVRLIKSGFKGAHISKPLFSYFIHKGSMSCNLELMTQTGKSIGEKYGFNYKQNKNHPRL